MKRLFPFILSLIMFSTCIQAQEVEIKISGKNFEKSILVNRDIKELNLTKPNSMVPSLIHISGLSELRNLKVLDISFTKITELTDISFFKDLSHIEEVKVGFLTIDNFEFLSYLQNLKSFVAYDFLEVTDQNFILDLSNNKNLEYIDTGFGEISAIPMIINPPLSLKYINLAGYKISNISLYDTVSYKLIISSRIIRELKNKPSCFISYSEYQEEVKDQELELSN